jgi:ribonuclease D
MIAIAVAVSEHEPIEQLIPTRMHPRRKESLAETIRVAQAVPPEKFPQVIRHVSQRPSEAEFRRFREIEKFRDKNAHELAIDPTLIASKATMGDLARDWEKFSPDLMLWQRDLLQVKS